MYLYAVRSPRSRIICNNSPGRCLVEDLRAVTVADTLTLTFTLALARHARQRRSAFSALRVSGRSA